MSGKLKCIRSPAEKGSAAFEVLRLPDSQCRVFVEQHGWHYVPKRCFRRLPAGGL